MPWPTVAASRSALVIPLLGWQFGLMFALRFGMGDGRTQSLRVVPFREQLNMGLLVVRNIADGAAFYLFLSLIFLLTVLAFLPIGQLCGRLMQRRQTLSAYGLNLLGSLGGVVLMLVLSWLWTPPLVWFSLCFLGTLLFYVRKPSSILLGGGAALVALTILAWPVDPLQAKIYSPYQELEFSDGPRGLLVLRAAGHYYQRILDLGTVQRRYRFRS